MPSINYYPISPFVEEFLPQEYYKMDMINKREEITFNRSFRKALSSIYFTFLPFQLYTPTKPSKPATMIYIMCKGCNKMNAGN